MTSSKMYEVLLFLALSFFWSFGYADDLTVEKRKDIQELIALSNSQLSEQVALGFSKQMLNALKRQYPNIVEEPALRVIQRELDASTTEVLLSLYNKHFTHKEIKETAAFMKSSTGRKYVAVLPAVMQDFATTTQLSGPAIGNRILASLQKEGIIPDQRANPPLQRDASPQSGSRP